MLNTLLPKGKKLYINDRHEEKDTHQEDRRKIYDKRILPLLTGNDSAVFAEPVDPFLHDYYRNLGLAGIRPENIFYADSYLDYSSLTEAVLNNHSLINEIKKRNFDILMPYIESENIQSLAEKTNLRILREALFTDWINNKTNYRQVIQELGFPMIPGFTVSNFEEAERKFKFLKNQGFKKILIKKERSVAGFGIFPLKTLKDLEIKLKSNFFDQKQFLLEGFIEKTTSPNVQYWVGPRKIKFIGASDQLLESDGVSYSGGSFPAEFINVSDVLEKITELSLRFCVYLQEKKTYGLIGIDWIITRDGLIYSPEANVRFNASTFNIMTVDKLFGSSENCFWKTFGVNGSPQSFESLFERFSDIFITQKGQFGVFPVGVDVLNSMGEGQFMAIGKNFEEVDNLTKRFRRLKIQ